MKTSFIFSLALVTYLTSDVSCFSTFVITGASGYLGREIVNTLLTDTEEEEEEAQIRCLVRPSRVEDEIHYWGTHYPKVSHRIKVYEYDMIDGGNTLKNALKHTDEDTCVFHVASVFTPNENHKQMALDNVKGTEDCIIAVSEACPKARVILTSSMAAVRCSNQVPKNGKYYTHEDWNTGSKLGVNWGASYQWSKAFSEKRAWELSKERNIPFTSLNPSFIFGPPSLPQASDSFSISTVSDWVFGKTPVQSRLCVDVRDVAKAHVLAAKERKTIGERIIISREARIPSVVMAEKIKQIAIETGISDPGKVHADTVFDGGIMKIGQKEVDCEERMKFFLNGFCARSVEETIADMTKVLLERK
jgi:nucleoside-diphosphate-sugar epimerase